MVELLFVLLCLTGIADLILIWTHNRTISYWFHRLFKYKTDFIIMIALALLILFTQGGHVFTWTVLGITMGHLLWYDKE